ncbi:uncharacterized protein P884DRAFT_20888 [Thermothelomyces heterothallicus CBS 202.75]|uniref:uncharacterized protein n=1 Tax=Thermothelomyces heterothallicus CBS 202.75 TaxID=1149848 RepID=UPI0037444CF5
MPRASLLSSIIETGAGGRPRPQAAGCFYRSILIGKPPVKPSMSRCQGGSNRPRYLTLAFTCNPSTQGTVPTLHFLYGQFHKALNVGQQPAARSPHPAARIPQPAASASSAGTSNVVKHKEQNHASTNTVT